MWIEAVAAVKLFEIERAERIAAGRVRPMRMRGRGRLRFFWLFDLEELDGVDHLDIQMDLAGRCRRGG